jgi:hypothetical protein
VIRLAVFLDDVPIPVAYLAQDQWQFVAAVGYVLAFTAGLFVGAKL